MRNHFYVPCLLVTEVVAPKDDTPFVLKELQEVGNKKVHLFHISAVYVRLGVISGDRGMRAAQVALVFSLVLGGVVVAQLEREVLYLLK